MPSFDAQTIVDGLQCTFEPFSRFNDTIKEPSDKQIGAFLKGLKTLMKGTRESLGLSEDGEIGTDPDELLKTLDNLEPEDFVKVMDEMAALHSHLCSGHPTKAEIIALPLRRRLLFFDWLQSEVMAPEAAPGAGRQGTPIHLRSAAG